MSGLAETLKGLVADLVTLKFRAHGYHWNVEGRDFTQYHDLFGSIYSDIDDSIDPMAENVRKLQDYVPYKLSRFVELSVLDDTNITSSASNMASDLLQANEIVIGQLMDAFDQANEENQQGVANFIAERIDAHQKWSWQLRASLHA